MHWQRGTRELLLIRGQPHSAFLSQVQSSLAANILSCLSALLGFILLSVNLAALGPAFWNCDLSKEDEVLDHHNSYYVSDSHDRDRVCFIAHGLLAVSILNGM